MTRYTKDRKFRLRDFNRRVKYGSMPYQNKEGHRYITIHPFSDDVETLRKIDLDPEQCVSVDAYWEMGHDVSFIQVSCSDCRIVRVRWEKQKKGFLSFSATVEDRQITKDVFERVMTEIVKKNIVPSEETRSQLSEKLVDVNEYR